MIQHFLPTPHLSDLRRRTIIATSTGRLILCQTKRHTKKNIQIIHPSKTEQASIVNVTEHKSIKNVNSKLSCKQTSAQQTAKRILIYEKPLTCPHTGHPKAIPSSPCAGR